MNDDEILQGATPIAHRVDDNVSSVLKAFTAYTFANCCSSQVSFTSPYKKSVFVLR